MSRLGAFLLGSMAAFGDLLPNSPTKVKSPNDKLWETIDIDAEYELIQQKKSKLSASMRDNVVRKYERRHRDNG